MGQKNQKRHNNSSSAMKRRAEEARVADEKMRARKRLDPVARTLMLGDVVFLSTCELLYRSGKIGDLASAVTTWIGLGVLAMALWFQFGPNSGKLK